MSGPPFPPSPQPGSNAIGAFVIGQSPIGPIESFQVWKTIISEYANSPILTQLCENIDAYVDQTTNFSNLFDWIWNVDSAEGVGLDVWGRIVGVNRVLQVAASEFFGFDQQNPTVDNFGPGGDSPFYVGVPTTGNYALSDQAYRQLIFAKALANICDGSILAINQILMNLFGGSGDCYVTEGSPVLDRWLGFDQQAPSVDGLGPAIGQSPFFSSVYTKMTMAYTFRFLLTPVQKAIIEQSGVLPKPVGVVATVVQIY